MSISTSSNNNNNNIDISEDCTENPRASKIRKVYIVNLEALLPAPPPEDYTLSTISIAPPTSPPYSPNPYYDNYVHTGTSVQNTEGFYSRSISPVNSTEYYTNYLESHHLSGEPQARLYYTNQYMLRDAYSHYEQDDWEINSLSDSEKITAEEPPTDYCTDNEVVPFEIINSEETEDCATICTQESDCDWLQNLSSQVGWKNKYWNFRYSIKAAYRTRGCCCGKCVPLSEVLDLQKAATFVPGTTESTGPPFAPFLDIVPALPNWKKHRKLFTASVAEAVDKLPRWKKPTTVLPKKPRGLFEDTTDEDEPAEFPKWKLPTIGVPSTIEEVLPVPDKLPKGTRVHSSKKRLHPRTARGLPQIQGIKYPPGWVHETVADSDEESKIAD